jgi:hypothetical protein
MTDLPPTLHRLGDAFEAAAESDLLAQRNLTRRRRRISTRTAIVATVLAVVVPAGAIAATQLVGTDEVAQSLPAGTLSLAGTNPTCAVVEQDVEYLCVLARAPAPEVADWKGTVEPTVDATKHINGGCRSLASDGREWRCYIGQAAVEQEIIAQDFLGEYAPSPGVG